MAAPTETSSLTKRAVRGATWTLPTSVASRAIGLVGTLLLARYIAPGDYGQVSAASIIILTASSLTTFGIGIYLVQTRELTRADVFHASCWFLFTGVFALGVTLALGRPLGRWFDAVDAFRSMPIFAAAALLDRVEYLPERMLIRELRFGWLSIVRGTSELTFTAVSVGLAMTGMGAIAIAWGNLARSALRFIAIVPAVDRREWLEPHRLRLEKLRQIIAYGMYVTVSGIATFAMRRWDNLLVSRYFGPAVMGAYNYAYNLADTPAVAVGEQMSDVISASFPHAKPATRATAVVRACTLMSLIMFPLAIGLGTIAPTVVSTFFNARWASVGTMLVYLSALSAPRPLAQIIYAYLYTCERPRTIMYLEWLSLGAILAAIATVGRLELDVNVACAAVGAVFVLRTLAAMWAVKRFDGIPLSAFLAPLVPPLLACGVMVGAILAVRPAFAGHRNAVRLAVEVATGGVVYVAAALVIARSASAELLRLVRSALSRR